jgi:hypothetical protein
MTYNLVLKTVGINFGNKKINFPKLYINKGRKGGRLCSTLTINSMLIRIKLYRVELH